MFSFYQVVRYQTPVKGGNDLADSFFSDAYGYFLGVAETSVDEMAVKLLTKKGTVITRKSVWALTRVQMEEQAEALKELAEGVKERLGDSIPDNELVGELENPLEDVEGSIFADLDEAVIRPADDASGNPMVTAREFTPETLDEYLGCKVSLPYGGTTERHCFEAQKGP